MYADDTTLSTTLQSIEPLESDKKNVADVINNELSNINDWLNINKLSLKVKLNILYIQ